MTPPGRKTLSHREPRRPSVTAGCMKGRRSGMHVTECQRAGVEPCWHDGPQARNARARMRDITNITLPAVGRRAKAGGGRSDLRCSISDRSRELDSAIKFPHCPWEAFPLTHCRSLPLFPHCYLKELHRSPTISADQQVAGEDQKGR